MNSTENLFLRYFVITAFVLCRPPVCRPGGRDSAARLAHGRRHQGAGAGDRHDEHRAVQVERQLAAGSDGLDRRTPGSGGGLFQGGDRAVEDGGF